MAENKIEVPKHLLKPVEPETPTIEITREIGFTINLQGYESAKISTSIKVGGALEFKDDIEKYVTEELESQISSQIGEIVAQHDTTKTLLGYRK